MKLNIGLLAILCTLALSGQVVGQSSDVEQIRRLFADAEQARQLAKRAAELRNDGRYDEAVPLTEQALSIVEKALGPNDSQVAVILTFLALLHDSRGDYGRAESLLRRALNIDEKVLGSNHPEVARFLINLAWLYEAKGDYARVMQCIQRSLEINERNLNLILATGSENQKQIYLDSLSAETDLAISLHIRFTPSDERAARLALTTILRRKGRALDAMTDQLAALRQHASAQDKQLLDQLAAARSQLAAIQLSSKAQVSPEARRAEIARLETTIERLEDEAGRRSAEFRSSSQNVTLEAVRAALPADAALVEIMAYHPADVKATNRSELYAQPRYAAYVLRRDVPTPQFVDLGVVDSLDAASSGLRSALQDPRRSDAKDLARSLDERLMRPVRQLLGPTRHILLSPDGALNLIPFAALVDERGQYLVENYMISYLTSGRDLLRLQAAHQGDAAPVVLADPLFDLTGTAAARPPVMQPPTDSAKHSNGSPRQKEEAPESRRSADFAALTYQPLPGTAAEARALRVLLPDAQFYLQRDATEAALKRVRGPQLLHVGTHGFFLTDQTFETNGQQVRGLGLDTESTGAIHPRLRENPLLRSGLILAGVKQGRSGAREDGVLTALEASGLDLWGTKLVVLSACETGLGDVRNGAGVYGLRRALVLAGSETQVMTLWQVSDIATRDLIINFYERLQKGEGRAEALRRVQLAMLKGEALNSTRGTRGLALGGSSTAARRNHPYYWAAFIESGAWGSMNYRKP